MSSLEESMDQVLDLIRCPSARNTRPFDLPEDDLSSLWNDDDIECARRAARLLETEFDRNFIRSYFRIFDVYFEALFQEHAYPRDHKGIADRLRQASKDPIPALESYVSRDPNSGEAQELQSALASSVRKTLRTFTPKGAFADDVLNFMHALKNSLQDDSAIHEEMATKRGRKRNQPFWMLTRETYRFAEERQLKLTLPTNETVQFNNSYTPLMIFFLNTLNDATAYARARTVMIPDTASDLRERMLAAISRDASTPEGTTLRRLRAYKQLRKRASIPPSNRHF